MPAPFHAIRDRALAQVDATFAEDVDLFFLSGGAADPARGNLTAKAVLRVGDRDDVAPSGSWGTRIAAGKAEAHINRAAYGGPVIRQGDKLRAVERIGQPFFEVLRVSDRGSGRLVLHLGEI
ncbi:hypothetical protein [Sediminimonas qiaohouensis]|uniref:hypothetical protein n=1 Tax=Sediminimonas qiaohouensis TaxID=552061 RepID=UPI000400FC88|nr:hypothetical protein [Sediminimonas qiaohouensis]